MKVGAWHLSIESNDCPKELTKIAAEIMDRQTDRQALFLHNARRQE